MSNAVINLVLLRLGVYSAKGMVASDGICYRIRRTKKVYSTGEK